MSDSKTFCLNAFKNLSVSSTGVITPCGVFLGSLKDRDGHPLRIKSGEIDTIWNHESLNTVRTKMLNGEAVENCSVCYANEKDFGKSERLSANNSVNNLEQVIAGFKNASGAFEFPIKMKVKIGNTCNLACRMCGPVESSALDEEFKNISKTAPDFRFFNNANAFDYNYDSEPISVAVNWTEDQLAISNLKTLFTYVEHLSISGGEFSVNAEAIRLLKFCVESNLSNYIDLQITTNLNVLTEEMLSLFSAFKKTMIIVSIDGIEAEHEYIRFPSKWPVVLENFKKLIEAPAHVIPVFSYTVQVYNLTGLYKTLQMVEGLKNSKWEKDAPIHLGILYNPYHLNVRILPYVFRREIKEKLSEFAAHSYFLKKHNVLNDQFQDLLNTLDCEHYALGNQSNEDHLSHFLQYTLLLDKSRGQKFNECLPELSKLIDDLYLFPAFPKNEEKSFSFYKYRDRGFYFQSLHKHKDALDIFTYAFELDEKDEHTLFAIGQCYKALGDMKQAEEYFTKLLAVNRGHYYNLMELAFIEKTRENFVKALEYFNDSKRVVPADRVGEPDIYIKNCEQDLLKA